MLRRLLAAAAAAILAGPIARAAEPTELQSALAAIRAVGREGAGNDAASAGWKKLVAARSDALFPVLAAFDGASPTAANWLRSAVDAIAEGEKKAGQKLPADKLESFATDIAKNPAARRIAFELLTAEVPSKKHELLPRMLDDSSLELRRDAIAAEMERIEKETDKVAKAKGYERLFRSARDRDQVEKLTAVLEPLGVKPDLTAHFGFVTRWYIAGPFDSPGGKGFDAVFPPEEKVDLSATCPGKGGAPVGWKPVGTARPKGHFALVRFNAELGKSKDAVAYAYAVVEVGKETPVELRAATSNSIKMFVNGKPVFARDEYHHGNSLDQHAGPAVLKPGRNEILVKVCQNDQKEEWAQDWEFEVRVCDATGGATPLTLVSPTVEQTPPAKEPKPAPKKEGK